MSTLSFIFVLTIYPTDTPPQSYVQDYNLTGADCIAAVAAQIKADPGMVQGTPSCEAYAPTGYTVEHAGQRIALEACPTEDSDNCLWDGMLHGNGRGASYYVLNGEVFMLD